MANRKINIAGNWKMNKTTGEAVELVDAIKSRVGDVKDVDVVVCPPFTALPTVVDAVKGTSIGVGSQNVHWEESGAFTGEIAPSMLCDLNVEYAIIGHSERRQYFGETDETVNSRLKAALSAGLKPIVCIGETLEQREDGSTESVIRTQIENGLADLTPEDMQKTILAYEPVWAIGTGKTATPEQAQSIHAFIRDLLQNKFGDVAEGVVIQYGGSVKPANAKELLGQKDIDGALVGGASLKPDAFAEIVQCASE